MECMLERRPTRAYVEEEREERVYHPPPSVLQVRHPSLHPHLLQLLSISTYRFACFSSYSKNMLYQIAFWTLWICMTYTMSFWSSFNVYRIYTFWCSCRFVSLILMKYNMLHLIWCQVCLHIEIRGIHCGYRFFRILLSNSGIQSFKKAVIQILEWHSLIGYFG